MGHPQHLWSRWSEYSIHLTIFTALIWTCCSRSTSFLLVTFLLVQGTAGFLGSSMWCQGMSRLYSSNISQFFCPGQISMIPCPAYISDWDCPNPGARTCIWPWTTLDSHRPTSQACQSPLDPPSIPSGVLTLPLNLVFLTNLLRVLNPTDHVPNKDVVGPNTNSWEGQFGREGLKVEEWWGGC